MTIEYLKYAAFTWVSLCFCFAIYKISKGHLNSINFVMITFYILFGLPVFFDLVFGLPDYTQQPGFQLSQGDFAVNIIYLLYISFIPLLWLGFSRHVDAISWFPQLNFNLAITCFLYILISMPMFILLLFPEARVQLNYGVATTNESDTGITNVINFFTFLSIFATLLIFLAQRNIIYSVFTLLPWPILSIWLNGKRTIILLFLIGLLTSLVFKRVLNGLRMIIFASVVLLIFFSFSNFYQSNVRSKGIDNVTSSQVYTNTRVDYGRDDVTKMTIYAELNPNVMKILDYRGESFIFTALPFIPRSIWPNKPLPYAQYITSAMLFSPPQLWGWGMTTSILEEGIANFSWAGMLISPLIILIICIYGDRSQNLILSMSTVLVTSLLLAVQIIAFYPIIAIYFIFLIYKNKKVSEARKELINSNAAQTTH